MRMHVCMRVSLFVCSIKSFSSHPWENHKEGIIMTTYVQPLATFLTTDEVCNLFSMLFSNRQSRALTHLTCMLLKNKANFSDCLQTNNEMVLLEVNLCTQSSVYLTPMCQRAQLLSKKY